MAAERRGIPAITSDQMAEVDRVMIEDYGIQLIQMMENAGRNLAEQARRMLSGSLAGRSIVVLCGSGNNGGGGMVAARHLANRGARVQAFLIGDAERLKDVPKQQWHILNAIQVAIDHEPQLNDVELIVDAMIGYGLTGNPQGGAADWIERVNTAQRIVLALDTPSGLNLATGVPGTPCIRATATLSLALPKDGLLTDAARAVVGDLYLADISVPPVLYQRFGLDVGVVFNSDSIIPIVGEPIQPGR